MTEYPSPLTLENCDLRAFPYMELDVRRLRDSKFATVTSGDCFRAGLLLWCAAWHQVPAASLPDNDFELANLAGYGRVIKEWKKVKEEALSGFIKCSDGRLYHPVIAEKANAAFASKERYAYNKFTERMRKENAKREKEGKKSFGIPDVEIWKSGKYPCGIPPEGDQIPPENAHIPPGIPPENALRGNGTERRGNGDINTVPIGTDGAAVIPSVELPPDPPPPTIEELTKVELWRVGKSLLLSAGMPKVQCGSFVGKLCKDFGDEVVIEAVRETCVKQPVDPAEYLKASCMRIKGKRPSTNRQEQLENRNQQVAQDWAQQGEKHANG
jgi:hypothetical protein